MSQAGIQSYIDKWLAVQPQQALALAFVDPQRHPGHVALAALEQELLSAAYGIRETQVAAAKLNWWAEELAAARHSGGRHPLTQALFADERATCIADERWLAPVLAAMAQLEEGTASDFAAQLATAAQLHGALAALETEWWYGQHASAARATRVASLAHLLHALLRLEEDAERDRLAIPMARLARFGLSRSQLRGEGMPRTEAVKAQLSDLASAWQESTRLDGPLSAFRGLESRHGARLVRKAQRATKPLEILRQGQQWRGPGVTWQAWQAAREWQRHSREFRK